MTVNKGIPEDITDEMFNEKLLEMCESTPMIAILRVEGVYEALAEHFNNNVIDALCKVQED